MSLHISAAETGDIAENVLLPGDPMRAKYIAENYLENARMYSQVRNMYGFTGTYKGVPISVQGTGMGMPSMGIYSYELIHEYHCQNLIRVGTAGSFREDLGLGWLRSEHRPIPTSSIHMISRATMRQLQAMSFSQKSGMLPMIPGSNSPPAISYPVMCSMNMIRTGGSPGRRSESWALKWKPRHCI